MTAGLPGSPEIRYGVFINDPLGNRLADASGDIVRVEGACAVGTVGVASLIFPLDYPTDFIGDDYIVELWRYPLNGAPALIANRLWWMRDFEESGQEKEELKKVICYDQNFLLASPNGQAGRIIAYDEGEAQTGKVDAIDDMMKAYVRENMGSLATDTDRDLSIYLTVAGDSGLGPVGHSEGTSRRNLLSVLNDLSAMAASLGTYVAWDIVCTQPPDSTRTGTKFALEFRTYIGARGADRRASSGNPFLIGPDFGNLSQWSYTRQTANEATSVYARGAGVGTAAAVAQAISPRLGISPFNRRELLVDSQGEDSLAIADDADSGLRANRPRQVLSGVLTDPDLFGVEFDFGAYLTAQVRGRSFDCRLDAMQFTFERGGETLRPVLRFDDV